MLPSAIHAEDASDALRDPADEAGPLPFAWRTLAVAALRASGAVLALGLWAWVARALGAGGSGALRQGLALALLAGTLIRLGLDTVVLRELALAGGAGAGRPSPAARRFLTRVFALVAGLGLPVSLAVWGASGPLARQVLGEPELAPVLAWCALAVVPVALLAVGSEAHVGLGRPAWGTFLLFNARNLLFLVGALAFALVPAPGADPNAAIAGAARLLAAVAWGAALLALPGLVGPARARDRAPTLAPPHTPPRLSQALASARPLYHCALLALSLEWLDTLLLGARVDSASVGIYGGAVSAALVLSFLLHAANVVLAPRLARAFHAGQGRRLEAEARRTTRWLLWAVLPAAVVLGLFAGDLLAWFGPEFRRGALAFRILLVGQVFNVLTGPVGMLLLMARRERAYRDNLALAVGVHVVLLLVLVPGFGITGAAIATAAAMALVNLLHLCACRRELGLSTIGAARSTAHGRPT